MRVMWKYVYFLVWVAFILITPLLLFSKGFLLSRHIVHAYSYCASDFNVEEKLDTSSKLKYETIKSYSQNCVYSPYKVIVIIIDALRYDFVERKESDEAFKIYHNKLTSIHEMLNNKKRSRLYKFIADPPTTTMQRLHGMMTGSLPTFVDIGSNFASSEILEDNLLNQLKRRNMTAVHLGDDTWSKLFPRHFTRSYPFPSFNVWDLDTVDTGINDMIIDEIHKPDWKLLIAHYLGVDHCGHRYGPNHQEMDRKLTEMNDVIGKVSQAMDNQTFLFVMGDHGMTEHGDHGGSSTEEITAALFVHSPVDLVTDSGIATTAVRQIDLLPTISNLLGVAIPFSNLGSLIIDLVPSHLLSTDLGSNIEAVFSLLWKNILQISQYVKEYSSLKTNFPQSSFRHLTKQFDYLKTEYYKDHNLFQLLPEGKLFLSSVQEVFENIWAQFNFFAIYSGLFLLAGSFFVLLSFSRVSEDFEKSINKHNVVLNFLCCLMFSLVVTFGMHLILGVDCEILFYGISCFSSFVFVIYLYNLRFLNLTIFKDSKGNTSFLAFYFFAAVGLFSNSYIVSESDVVSFLFLTIVWICLIKIIFGKRSWTDSSFKGKIKLFFYKKEFLFLTSIFINIGIRSSRYFWQCFEDQANKCQGFKLPSICSNLISIVVFSFFKSGLFILLERLQMECGTGFNAKYCFNVPVISFIFLFCYWTLDCLHSLQMFTLFPSWALHFLPQMACGLSITGMVIVFTSPLSVFNIFYKGEKLFNDDFRKGFFLKSKNKESSLRLDRIYSGVFMILLIFWSLLSATLLGEKRSLSSVIMFLSMAGLLMLTSALKVFSVNAPSQLLNVSWLEIVAWQLSALLHFYGTGHQTTFSSLHWDSVVVFGEYVPLFVPGFMMVVNTFLSQIVHSFFLPLVLVVPLSLGSHLPKGLAAEENELVLFNNTSKRRQVMCSLFARYFLLHVARVFCIMFSCTIHSRHLMVWKIFAPKFIFEGISFMVSLPSSILGFLLVERISNQIQHFIVKKNFEIVQVVPK